MKPFLLLLLLLLHCTGDAQTRQGDHDLSVGYGVLSGRQIGDYLTHGDNGGGMYDNSNTGNIFLTYRYFALNWLSIGITAGNQTLWGSFYQNTSSSEPVYNYKYSNTTIAAELMLLYSNNDGIQFYTVMGAGTSVYHETDHPVTPQWYIPGQLTGIKFNWQYIPVGVRFGGKFGGFMELGVGYKGIFNGGLYYTIHKPKQHVVNDKKEREM